MLDSLIDFNINIHTGDGLYSCASVNTLYNVAGQTYC